MGVLIREATDNDRDDLTRLLLDFRNEHSRMIGGEGSVTLDEAADEVQENLGRQDTGYCVALDSASKRLFGFRRWELHDEFYFTRELYVIPDMRGQGVARELIRHFEQWVCEKGQDYACISCTPHNVAMMILARSEGYQILNMIEVAKHLGENPATPRSQTEAVGLKWKVR